MHRLPLRYQPSYWSLVFPLGMYAVATEELRTILDLDALARVPPVAFGVGLPAWTATAVGLLPGGLSAGRRLHGSVRRR